MYRHRAGIENVENRRRKLIDQFVFELAQLWVVARCRCPVMKGWHSLSHLDCFSVDPWLVDELRTCTENLVDSLDGRNNNKVIMRPSDAIRWRQSIERRLSRCSESSDSLTNIVEPDSLCNSSRR
ncbi:unnamed protein product [Bursaphelenchus xylophilus]|uniref:(pine wood nematode) hypothetical protein n=1 Tax=Bursaphelenchus xylophilus TaxID=6326 RepID=A0A1I7SPY4_BURXY|nr:unnamed protein product [Bursaphelenchus xylophilus]CAG9109359.1 unnamed protein product [Bursaphelenchus xylophilus]